MYSWTHVCWMCVRLLYIFFMCLYLKFLFGKRWLTFLVVMVYLYSKFSD